MQTQEHQRRSLDAICGSVAGLRQQPESEEHEFWQERLSSMQEWICELLIENQQLRMSSARRKSHEAF